MFVSSSVVNASAMTKLLSLASSLGVRRVAYSLFGQALQPSADLRALVTAAKTVSLTVFLPGLLLEHFNETWPVVQMSEGVHVLPIPQRMPPSAPLPVIAAKDYGLLVHESLAHSTIGIHSRVLYALSELYTPASMADYLCTALSSNVTLGVIPDSAHLDMPLSWAFWNGVGHDMLMRSLDVCRTLCPDLQTMHMWLDDCGDVNTTGINDKNDKNALTKPLDAVSSGSGSSSGNSRRGNDAMTGGLNPNVALQAKFAGKMRVMNGWSMVASFAAVAVLAAGVATALYHVHQRRV